MYDPEEGKNAKIAELEFIIKGFKNMLNNPDFQMTPDERTDLEERLIQKEKELIFNMPNITVQDIRELDIRTTSIKHALTLIETTYTQIHDTDNTSINEDTFVAIMPSVYSNYVHNDDVANLNEFE